MYFFEIHSTHYYIYENQDFLSFREQDNSALCSSVSLLDSMMYLFRDPIEMGLTLIFCNTLFTSFRSSVLVVLVCFFVLMSSTTASLMFFLVFLDVTDFSRSSSLYEKLFMLLVA